MGGWLAALQAIWSLIPRTELWVLVHQLWLEMLLLTGLTCQTQVSFHPWSATEGGFKTPTCPGGNWLLCKFSSYLYC